MKKSGGSGGVEQDRLMGDFPVAGLDQWHDEVVRLLKGAPFEKRMFTTTIDGLTLKPMYTGADTAGLVPPDRPAIEWDVAQELPVADPGAFNRQLRNDLECGQTAVNLVLDSTAIESQADFDLALEGIDLEQIPLYIQAGGKGLAVAQLLRAACAARGVNTERLAGALGFDPLARHSDRPVSIEQIWDDQAELTRWALESAPNLRTVVVEGRLWHEAGAGAAEELAFSMASAVAALRELEIRGIDPGQAARSVWFCFAVGTDFFTEIAKFRAARLLWSKIVEACGLDGEAAALVFHARSSGWSSTVFDPHTNILRSTTQAFAAIAGGCSSLHLAPFDERSGPAGELACRLARNTQLILRDESHFDRVADPAGGSWYVEALTDQLARRSWELFQGIEGGGGMGRAIDDGRPQRMTAATAAQRRERLATREDVLVGTNRYPLVGEIPPASSGAPYSGLRGDAQFAALRLRVANAGPPRVLLAAMGPPAGYMARLEFTRSFYQVGGFDVLGGQGFDDVDAAVDAVRRLRPAAVCIVSRDERYQDLLPGLAADLAALDRNLVLHVAGGSEKDLELFRAAGGGQRITIRSNILDVLEGLAEQVGVTS